MRVLSIQQPWAELVIRGVKTFEVRSWSATHQGGRIAIHASANIELKKVEALWADDRAVAQCFADQGWMDRDDLRALPRSAIIGSVALRGVHPATAVRAANLDLSATNWVEDALETAVRDPVSGALRPGPAPVRTLPVAVPARSWVFGFARALAVEPILDVEGQQHLWALPPALATELAAREARARTGEWTRPAPSPERIKAARDAWRERFESEETRYGLRLIREAIDEAANDAMTLEAEGAERMLKEAMRKLTSGRDARDADGRLWVRVPKALRPLFDDAERVPAVRFEADLRMLMHRVRLQEQANVEYQKLLDAAVERVREGAERAERSPSSRSALEAEVKRAFKREWLAVEAELARNDGYFHFPEY
ncbi:MAG: ASCH domain-containing protein [Gemmatimonadaceae bacterium]|nr:ASCH domain-containing protein [Gemmatimonadaceae bacterium]